MCCQIFVCSSSRDTPLTQNLFPATALPPEKAALPQNQSAAIPVTFTSLVSVEILILFEGLSTRIVCVCIECANKSNVAILYAHTYHYF